MISETRLASSYSSFWRNQLPNSEGVIRWLNLTADRFSAPVISTSSPGRHGYINEMAFHLFANAHPTACPEGEILDAALRNADFITRQRFSRIENADIDEITCISREEIPEVCALAHALFSFCSGYFPSFYNVVFKPSFPGYGIVNACEGDVVIKGPDGIDNLIEIKAGDRSFRSIDLRQMLIYCALNSASPHLNIANLTCLNPRLGIFFSVKVDDLCLQLCGKAPGDLFAEILFFLEGRGNSN